MPHSEVVVFNDQNRLNNRELWTLNLLVRHSQTQAARFNRDDGAWFEIAPMPQQDFMTGQSLLLRPDINQPNDPRMPEATNNGQFSEVLIECHENAIFLISTFQNGPISRVFF